MEKKRIKQTNGNQINGNQTNQTNGNMVHKAAKRRPLDLKIR